MRLGLFERLFIKSLVLGVVLVLSGCVSSPGTVPVTSRTKPPKVTAGYHIVRPGETLFSIAWRYGWDYRKLASANNIPYPYTIFPKQKIHFGASKASQKKVYNSAKKQKMQVTSSKRVINTSPSSTTKPVVTSSSVHWQWPVTGALLSVFSNSGSLNKGIDIAGKLGQPVKAAAEGEVVYAGSGLLGYGRLIIIKHNSTYLSAYAHSRAILVREGQTVKAGQIIAELGSSGTNRPKLHFEIRRKGEPVNPLSYLPRRKS